MSRTILDISTESFAIPIRALRDRLGLKQEEFSRNIGCSVYAFQRWETGKRIPSGDWLIKIIQLCPDAESIEAFGLKSEILNLKSPPGAAATGPDPYEDDFKNLRTIIDSGQSQLIGKAEEVLARLADKAQIMTQKNKRKG